MKITVCMCRVPDTATRIVIAASGTSIETQGVQYIVNPFDEFALEEAIKLKEKAPGSTVTVFTVGKDDAQKDLKTALAKGADAAVIIKADGALDASAVARLLADAITAAGGTDAVWCGKQSVEDDAAAVGPMLAALLDLPCVTRLVGFESDGATFKATREIEGGREEIGGAFPCVFTADKGLNKPRQAGLKEIMAAGKKPLTSTTGTAAAATVVVGMAPPAERPAGRIVGNGAAVVAPVIDLLRNESKVI